MADKIPAMSGERRILTLQDERNAMAVLYHGSRICFRSTHKWERTRSYIEVVLDRAVIRELAKELWRAAGLCDVLAERDGLTRHKEGMTPVDEEVWENDTSMGIPPMYLWGDDTEESK